MKKTVYFTRHGETVWNTQNRMQGRKDSPLTETGIDQAHKLKRRLKNVHFDKVFSSPSPRAIKTAEIVSERKDIITDERIMEISVGSWEGKVVDDIMKKEPDALNLYLNTPHLLNYEGIETCAEIMARAESFLRDLIKQDGDTFLVVSHGVTLKAISMILQKESVELFRVGGFFRQTALTIAEIDEALNANIVTAYCTKHLE